VGGSPISEAELLGKVAPQLQQLRHQEYQLKEDALESLINEKLVAAEAARRSISPAELLAQEVDSKVRQLTDAELQAVYTEQKSRINRPFEEIKEQLRQVLHDARLQEARKDFYQRLREQAEVTVLLSPPRLDVRPDPSRLRGNPDAPIQMVEFSDFQCPYCLKAYPIAREVLAKYPEQVNLSYRDYPLREMHPEAQLAAEASRCAGEQGKFWEFHDLLFENPSRMNEEAFSEYAALLGTDSERFQACLQSGRFKQSIEEDFQEGMRLGIMGTPAFFINGILVSGAQSVSVFEKLIESELAARGGRSSAP
jgi:protein-disulfide isomerase